MTSAVFGCCPNCLRLGAACAKPQAAIAPNVIAVAILPNKSCWQSGENARDPLLCAG
jgi:hypothetical protein